MGPVAAGPPIVFLGPTLPVEEAGRILPADYRPPAAQGSVVAAAGARRPAAILLIDGVFKGEPAIRHKEILWALSRGIPVFGAASMGALRAAELHRHGMVGVGLVYRWYRRFPLLPDDAVAVLHGPPEMGSRPLTQALVDLRMTLRAAAREGAIGHAARTRLERAAASLNFRERTLAAAVEHAFASELDRAARTALAGALAARLVDQKRRDALHALCVVRGLHQGGGLVAGPGFPFTWTTAFLRDLRHAGLETAIRW
ncbi:MAG: TfuA-like protein [Alphaproteobacteria bacterium]